MVSRERGVARRGQQAMLYKSVLKFVIPGAITSTPWMVPLRAGLFRRFPGNMDPALTLTGRQAKAIKGMRWKAKKSGDTRLLLRCHAVLMLDHGLIPDAVASIMQRPCGLGWKLRGTGLSSTSFRHTHPSSTRLKKCGKPPRKPRFTTDSSKTLINCTIRCFDDSIVFKEIQVH